MLALATLLAVSCPTAQAEQAPVRISAGSTRAALKRIDIAPEISFTVARIAREAVRKFADTGLTADGLGIAVILDTDTPAMGGYNMDRSFYPASVVKICYAAALEKDFADGRLPREADTLADLDRMLVVSSNAATNRILDRLTGTESGPELPEAELKEFARKRNAVNVYMRSLGFTGFNACQKTWDDTPFGRDTQFLGARYENRNAMTPADTARLVWAIRCQKIVSRPACEEMLKYMSRKPNDPRDIQARRIGAGIPPSSRLWSKAGWTSNTNHDAAYVELPLGDPFVLAIFTNTSYKHAVIHEWITRQVTSAVQLKQLRPEMGRAPLRGLPGTATPS